MSSCRETCYMIPARILLSESLHGAVCVEAKLVLLHS